MGTSDISEAGLELIIVSAMTGLSRSEIIAGGGKKSAAEAPEPLVGLSNWRLGDPRDYDRQFCVDLLQLSQFLKDTQPAIAEAMSIDQDTPIRREFLNRLKTEIGKRGVIDVLRNGLSHKAHDLILFFATPSKENEKARLLHAMNRFSITRQLRYSEDANRLALDLAIFINGLPFATFELKNSLTKQTVQHAVEQYQRDRDPAEPLFSFGRCAVHFAVDDSEVRMCTELKGKSSWFLPFNIGFNDGAGNPPNPSGLKTDYLWKRIITPQGLTDILENYAQIIEERDPKTGKKRKRQIFPRYHQLSAVRTLLRDAAKDGPGHRYLIQHSAGSGKSNSIAWLAHQLTGIETAGAKTFDTIIVVTDRRILDSQIRNTIKQFAQVGSTVAAVEQGSAQLREFIEGGKKIIISTVQKFPVILNSIGDEHRNRRFAIIIDEAHSSQSGRTSSAMSSVLSNVLDEEEKERPDDYDPEDRINDLIADRMAKRKLPPNASYFAFTATPKNKTLEMFGDRRVVDGEVQYLPRHGYTMKQATEEGFIRDVLKNYTPVSSYYRLIKTVPDDPEFDVSRAKKKLRAYVEGHDHPIRLKAEIMVDHFHEQVIAKRLVGGEARAMVVTNGIERAIKYFFAIRAYLEERKSPYKAIVAFSGEFEIGGKKESEASLNGFPSKDIADKIQDEPYRFLICADKFQTGYDEPLLQTMYVDKTLSGVKAVQTLSRLNRAHPAKRDVFVLDFHNDIDGIMMSFAPFYRTTILAGETDSNRLHDMQSVLEEHEVYLDDEVDSLVAKFLDGVSRDQLDPILDQCDARYDNLPEDAQVEFKGTAKAFVRSYEFLASILPYTNQTWEKLSIFLNLLIPKLKSPKNDDLTHGILETIDMDSYRVEKKATAQINLPDENGRIEPVPVEGGGLRPEAEIEKLSNIIKGFNDQFGTLFDDGDRVLKKLRDDVAPKVAADEAFQNAKKNTPSMARTEYERALKRVMLDLVTDDTEVFKQFQDNPSFKRFVSDLVYKIAAE